MRNLFVFFSFFASITCGFAQNTISVHAQLDEENRTLSIHQEINYKNTSNSVLEEIYLNDWANAFTHKTTPLGQRFAEEYQRKFHFAGEQERGETTIYSITNPAADSLTWTRPSGAPDILRLALKEKLNPGETTTLIFDYSVRIPSDKFTRYGVDPAGNYKLRYWYLTPAVFDQDWQIYSHKNLDDQFTPPANLDITLLIPPRYYVASALNTASTETTNGLKSINLTGKNRVDSKLYLTHSYLFESFSAGEHEVLTNIEDDGLPPPIKALMLRRILRFLDTRLGEYPHKKIFVTQDDYLSSPIYGLNQLPGFIRPFPDGFQYDIKQFKTITSHFLENTLLLNPREEHWVNDAILVSLMIDYVNRYYPRMKVIGSLSDIIGIRWFHAADLEFNDQYQFLYMNMARLNLDQPLTTAQDSLLKFNKNIANPYKAGIGLKYVENYLESEAVKNSISEFYSKYRLQPVSHQDFEKILQQNAEKDLSWFFNDYVATNKKIDFKIKGLKKTEDSLQVKIKNKRDSDMPVSLYGLNQDRIIWKTWVENIEDTKTVSIPKAGVDRVALNYEGKIPEFNQRDNYRRVNTIFNKPLQFRLLQDVEDPRFLQVFLMPEFDYNLYDGISIGPKLYNKTVLNKNFVFNLSPKFGFNSKTLVGSASLGNTHQFQNKELRSITYGISGTRFSYAYDLFYHKYSPFLRFSFRNKYLRDNERQSLLIRNVNVERDLDPARPINQPNYNVFNVNYSFRKPHLVDHYSAIFDYQLAGKFSKISMELEYRKLFRNNRQINLRLFAGTFLYNDHQDNDYFSFALDRPTDYLFDYNYYGRSQGSGLFSQQIIMAEGGFKSQLQPEYANQWLTTLNASTNLWKWIFLYGDAGVIKNKYNTPSFLYDSGIRISMVDDYFEVFFPVYSSLGWEINQPDYDQRIRFIVSLDLNTLIRLFTRRWY